MGEQIREIMHTDEEYEKAAPLLREKSKEISSMFRNTYKALLLKMVENIEFLDKGKKKDSFSY